MPDWFGLPLVVVSCYKFGMKKYGLAGAFGVGLWLDVLRLGKWGISGLWLIGLTVALGFVEGEVESKWKGVYVVLGAVFMWAYRSLVMGNWNLVSWLIQVIMLPIWYWLVNWLDEHHQERILVRSR